MPLPADNTKRYFLIYAVDTEVHRMQFRCADSIGDATALANIAALVTAIAPTAGSNTTYAGVEVALRGSNVINPVAGFTPVSGGSGSVSGATLQNAWCISARAPSGHKAKIFLFGLFIALPADYKQDPLTDAGLQGFQGLLNSQSEFSLAIDGTKQVWYFRATVKAHDHWVDHVR